MKARFEWQTDEDDPLDQSDDTQAAASPRKKLGCTAAIILVSVVTIFLLTWSIKRRQSNTLGKIREEIILAFELQQTALMKNDSELFRLTLSSSDTLWRQEQKRLFDEGLFYGGLADGAEPLLTLSPDLRTAELTYTRSYPSEVGVTGFSDIELLHTATYRLEEKRWLQSAPEASFWGAWQDLDGSLITITTPERDVELAKRLLMELDFAIRSMCAGVEAENIYGVALCEEQLPLRVLLNNDVKTLYTLTGEPVTPDDEYDYELPAPTLVGLPIDEKDYETYFKVYTRPLLHRLEMILQASAPFPSQNIYALCFNHPLEGRHLYRYDRRLNAWEAVMPQKTFRYMSVFPDDSAVMLFDGTTVNVLNSRNDAQFQSPGGIWQRGLPADTSQNLIGWISGVAPYHLAKQTSADGGTSSYSVLDLTECDRNDCYFTDLPGFPNWERSSGISLYQIGSNIYLGTRNGETIRQVGRGFNPFWMDDSTFGYVRFTGERDYGISSELVLGNPDNEDIRILFDGDDLARAAGISEEHVLFINDVVYDPSIPNSLLLSATGIREHSGYYFIFVADLTGWQNNIQPNLKLAVRRHAAQGSVPGLLTPTGLPPFLVSSSGRWLVMTELHGQDQESWTILIHDLQSGESVELNDSVPAMPGNYPLLDWSEDGQWLLVADRGFLHLIAPQYDYQESIAHSFDACSHIAWAD